MRAPLISFIFLLTLVAQFAGAEVRSPSSVGGLPSRLPVSEKKDAKPSTADPSAGRVAAPAAASAVTARDPQAEREARVIRGNAERAGFFINETLKVTRELQPTCFNCTSTQAGQAISPQCRAAYEEYYRNDTINIQFTLGYIDTTAFGLVDLPMRAALEERLAPRGSERPPQECPPREFVCGFVRDPDDANLFTKTVPGPDGRPRTIRLNLDNASVSTLDRNNRTDPRQAVRSQQSRDQFLNALGRPQNGRSNAADIAIVIAHSRYGAGFGFDPPLTYAQYQRPQNQRNREEMFAALRGANPPPKFFGMFGCNSDRDFADEVRIATGNKTAVVTESGAVPPEAALSHAFTTLDSLLAMRCEDTFDRGYRAVTSVTDEPVRSRPRMIGVFDRAGQTNDPNLNQSTVPPTRFQNGNGTVANPPVISPGAPVGPANPQDPRVPSGQSRPTTR